jgi:Bacterial regulatory protein, arsR family
VLAARGTCVCGEVVEVMPLAQATVSQHLKVLKEAGLIRGRIDGKNSCYCLDPCGIADPCAEQLTSGPTGGAQQVGGHPEPCNRLRHWRMAKTL